MRRNLPDELIVNGRKYVRPSPHPSVVDAILCAECGGTSHVVQTYGQYGTAKRRRRCDACGARWTTLEGRA